MSFLPRSIRIEDLVDSMLSRREALGIGSPWSVAELALDDDDYIQLNRWAEAVDGESVVEWVRTHWIYADPASLKRPKRACLGLLLLALAAEAARREATEATLWPYVRRRPDGELRFPEADAVLFVQDQDKSAPAFREAIEAAVFEFGLRHVVNQPDVKRYYLTIFLQCGFPIRDARGVLGAWLAGQNLPVALRLLLDRKGPLGSLSFATLWRDLRHARGGLIAPETIRGKLEKSPWVLADWADELVKRLGLVRNLAAPGGPSTQSDDLAEVLGQPRLRWPDVSEPPRFDCELQRLTSLRLSGREYTLRVGGRVVARVEWDGTKFTASRPTVAIPGFPATAVVEWRDEESGESEAIAIECFDPLQPATVFDLGSGRPVRPGTPLEFRRCYALVYAADLTLSPEATNWKHFKSGPLLLRVVTLPGDPALAKLTTHDGAVVWEASTFGESAVRPTWATATLRVYGAAGGRSVAVGARYQVAIGHHPDTRVAFVRLGMEPLEPKASGPGTTLVGPVVTSPATIGRRLQWLIGLERNGMLVRVTPRFDPDRHGGALFRNEAWDVLDSRNSLDASDARNSPLLILAPRAWDGRQIDDRRETWAVMEGESWVDSVRDRPRAVPRIAGLGGRLTVRLGPFNATPATPPEGGPPRIDALILADRVVDRGIVRAAEPAERDEGCSAWRVELSHVIEIAPEHEVRWWDRSGEVHHLRPQPWTDGEPTRADWWMVTPPVTANSPRALMVTYRGRRLGAWWAAGWADNLATLADARGASAMADLVRDFRLPALEDGSLAEVRGFATRHSGVVLGSWLIATTPTDWLAVARASFRDWEPLQEQLGDLAEQVVGASPFPEVAVALRLMDVCPILMGRYLRARLKGVSFLERRWLLDEIRSRVEELLRFEVCDLVGTDESMLDGIKRATKLDPGFLQSLNQAGASAVLGLQGDVEYDQRANLDLAVLQFNACRYLLTMDILQSVDKGVISSWKGKNCATA